MRVDERTGRYIPIAKYMYNRWIVMNLLVPDTHPRPAGNVKTKIQ